MSALDRPVGMTWVTPNMVGDIPGLFTKGKPLYVDGSWVEAFTPMRIWHGVYVRKLYPQASAKDVNEHEVLDWPDVEWVIWRELYEWHFLSEYPIKYKYYIAYDKHYRIKALVIDENCRLEFSIKDVKSSLTEIKKMLEAYYS